MSAITALVGKKTVLPANTFKKTNFIFTGWNTKADGTGISYKNKNTVLNLAKADGEVITLYAQWTLEGSSNLAASDVTDTINSNGSYTVWKERKWLLSATVYDSRGNIIDSKTNSRKTTANLPSTIKFSSLSKGEYYIRYTYCGYNKKTYNKPIYIDNMHSYNTYDPAGDTIVETMKLTVKEYPSKLDVSRGSVNSVNNKTFYAKTDTAISVSCANSLWLYTCVIAKDGKNYSNNTWSEPGEPHRFYDIGKLDKGTYVISVEEYGCGEETEMVYDSRGVLTFRGTGIYYPDIDHSTKVTWQCTIIVE